MQDAAWYAVNGQTTAAQNLATAVIPLQGLEKRNFRISATDLNAGVREANGFMPQLMVKCTEAFSPVTYTPK